MLGVAMRALIINKSIQRVVIAFVDNINFYTNGRNYGNKIQMILDIYIVLYKAIGGTR